MCAEGNFYLFVHSDLDLIFAPLVTLVQRYVSAVSTAFIFRKIEGTGRAEAQTDGVEMRPPIA